jgi:hypothetical protein
VYYALLRKEYGGRVVKERRRGQMMWQGISSEQDLQVRVITVVGN